MSSANSTPQCWSLFVVVTDPAVPLGVPAQERLIALVAEHLLDRNGEDSMAACATDEFRANLARNVADAIDLLPKLVRVGFALLLFPVAAADIEPCCPKLYCICHCRTAKAPSFPGACADCA